MKPILIIEPKTMSDNNIKMLRDNGICVVVSKAPQAVKFVDPLPALSSRTEMENAAIALSRKILNGQVWGDEGTKTCMHHYVNLLISGTSLSARPTQAEAEKQAYNEAKLDEQRKIAREEARVERLTKKQSEKQTA